MIQFVRSGQDAKISLDRLGEIHAVAEEDGLNRATSAPASPPKSGDLLFQNISFKYNALAEEVLRDVTLLIPQGKTTAIVAPAAAARLPLLKLFARLLPTDKGKAYRSRP